MVGPLRGVGPAVEPAWSARLRPAWPPANPPTRPTSPRAPRAPTAPVHLGARTSPTVQIDESEHWRGSSDHMRRWNHPGMLAAGPRGRPRTLHLSGQPRGPRGRRTVRYILMSRDGPYGTDHCRWAFAPFVWSCETVKPARDACLGPGMSPDATVTERLFPTCPPRASIGTLQFDESGRPRRYKSLQTGVPSAQQVM